MRKINSCKWCGIKRNLIYTDNRTRVICVYCMEIKETLEYKRKKEIPVLSDTGPEYKQS